MRYLETFKRFRKVLDIKKMQYFREFIGAFFLALLPRPASRSFPIKLHPMRLMAASTEQNWRNPKRRLVVKLKVVVML